MCEGAIRLNDWHVLVRHKMSLSKRPSFLFSCMTGQEHTIIHITQQTQSTVCGKSSWYARYVQRILFKVQYQ